SRALSVAREQGMPEAVLTRAQEILGDAWRRQQERESEAETALGRLREAEQVLAHERESARAQAEGLASERASLARERARIAEQGLERFERARRELTRRLEEELSEIRKDSSRHAELSATRLANEIAQNVERQEGLDRVREEVSSSTGI